MNGLGSMEDLKSPCMIDDYDAKRKESSGDSTGVKISTNDGTSSKHTGPKMTGKVSMPISSEPASDDISKVDVVVDDRASLRENKDQGYPSFVE